MGSPCVLPRVAIDGKPKGGLNRTKSKAAELLWIQGKKENTEQRGGQRGDVGWEWGIPVSNEASDAAGPSWPSPPTTHLTCPLFSVHAPGAHNVFGFLYLGIFASRMHPTAPAAPTHLTCSLLTRWAYNVILEFLFLTCYMHLIIWDSYSHNTFLLCYIL